MKYLLLCAFLAIIWWIWSKRQVDGGQDLARQQEAAPEKMVSCAHCQVHLPESEGIVDDGRLYCCEAHRLAGPAVER